MTVSANTSDKSVLDCVKCRKILVAENASLVAEKMRGQNSKLTTPTKISKRKTDRLGYELTFTRTYVTPYVRVHHPQPHTTNSKSP